MILAKRIDDDIIIVYNRTTSPTYTLAVGNVSEFPHDGWDLYESVKAAYIAHGLEMPVYNGEIE